MTKIDGFTIHHASFLSLRDGTMVLPVGRQVLEYDRGGFFKLIEPTRWGPQTLQRYPAATIAAAQWY